MHYKRKETMILSVVTQKGGVGKTSACINLSVGLKKLGYKVACLDLDPQGHVSEGMGCSRKALKKSMFDVLIGVVEMKDIKRVLYGVDLYLSNGSLANFGVTVQDSANAKLYPNPYMILKNVLTQIKDEYDFVIIDTPATISIFNTNALNASTHALIPMQPEGMSVSGAVDILEFIRTIQRTSNKELKILGILATMVQNTNLHTTILQEVRKSFDKTDVVVFNNVIKRAIKYGLAQTNGVPDVKCFSEYANFIKEALV